MMYLVRHLLIKRIITVESDLVLEPKKRVLIEVNGETYYAHVLGDSKDTPSGKVVREITEADEIHYDLHIRRCLNFKEQAQKIANLNKIELKILAAEPLFDVSRIIFYFKTEKLFRIRYLAKLISDIVKTQVDLQQLEGREITRAIGDIGACGIQACCTRFLYTTPLLTQEDAREMWTDEPRSLGMCGRIKCCTLFEKKCEKGCSCKK